MSALGWVASSVGYAAVASLVLGAVTGTDEAMTAAHGGQRVSMVHAMLIAVLWPLSITLVLIHQGSLPIHRATKRHQEKDPDLIAARLERGGE